MKAALLALNEVHGDLGNDQRFSSSTRKVVLAEPDRSGAFG